MIAILGTILSSVLSGGATGLLGVLIQRFFDMKNKAQDIEVIKLQHQNAVDLRTVELKHVAAEWEGRQSVAVAEAAGLEAVAEQGRLAREAEAAAEAQTASYEHDRTRYYPGPLSGESTLTKFANGSISFLLGVVDVIRGLTRPGLTGYTMYLMTVMLFWALNLLSQVKAEQWTPTELKELVMMIVGTIAYLSTVGFVWWFGTRPPKRDGDK